MTTFNPPNDFEYPCCGAVRGESHRSYCEHPVSSKVRCAYCSVTFDSQRIMDGHDCPGLPATELAHKITDPPGGVAYQAPGYEFYQPGRLCTDCGTVMPLKEADLHICTPPVRASILDAAKAHTCGDRNQVHGDPIPMMERFMDLAQPIIDAEGIPKAMKGALIMDAYKTARVLHNPFHMDSWEDKCAYGAIAGEAAERSTK